jgi:3-deoxy-D-manno-octulosonic-acid transferase
MVYRLYDLALCLSALVLVPYYLFRGIRYGKARRGIRERLGRYSPEFRDAVKSRRVVWIHAVSVGETRAAIPLLKALRQKYPDHLLVISNVTETGHEVAGKLAYVDFCIFFPFDLSWIVQRVLTFVKPEAIILVETELWPNFVRAAKRLGIPVLLVNGRISDRSFPRYLKIGQISETILDCVTVFCMQSAKDGRRIKRLGAPPGRIVVTGNLKFDMALPAINKLDLEALADVYQTTEDHKIMVAGSTHAGEEQAVLGVYQRLRLKHAGLSLVLVPRHPERCRQVCDEMTKAGIPSVLRTALEKNHAPLPPEVVLVVDTVGEVLRFYAWSDIVFVGGSLVPVGGHNILEASLARKPVFFGPYMHNFKEIVALVKEAYGGIQVKDVEELYLHVDLLLNNPDEARRIGENGFNLLDENRGATARTLHEISRRI